MKDLIGSFHISAKESSDVSNPILNQMLLMDMKKKPITPEPILSEKLTNTTNKKMYSKSIIWTGTVSEAEEQFTTRY